LDKIDKASKAPYSRPNRIRLLELAEERILPKLAENYKNREKGF